MQSDCHRQVDGRPFDGRQVGDRPVDEGHTIFDLRQISLVLREMTGTQQLPAADITNAQEILTSIDSFLDEKLEWIFTTQTLISDIRKNKSLLIAK